VLPTRFEKLKKNIFDLLCLILNHVQEIGEKFYCLVGTIQNSCSKVSHITIIIACKCDKKMVKNYFAAYFRFISLPKKINDLDKEVVYFAHTWIHLSYGFIQLNSNFKISVAHNIFEVV